jgi:hypothetical protein
MAADWFTGYKRIFRRAHLLSQGAPKRRPWAMLFIPFGEKTKISLAHRN